MKKIISWVAMVTLAALMMVSAAWAESSQVNRTGISFPPMNKGNQKLIINFDQVSEKKCRAIVRELEKLSWKMEKPKDGTYSCKPDLVLDMDEFRIQLTVQNGGVTVSLLRFTATPKEIAKEIDGIQVAKFGVVINRVPSAGVELGRNFLERQGVGD